MSSGNITLNLSSARDCQYGCFLRIVGKELLLVPARESDSNVIWILNCAFLVVSMQLGFAMLEVGSARKSQRTTVLAKNVLDSTVSMIGFWIYCSWRGSQLVTDSDGKIQNHLILFQSAFCGTAVTICGGSMAERAHMHAYLFFAVLMSLFIYPEIAEGAWTQNSMLSSQFHQPSGYRYHDFAGSGVVHLTGGCCALIGNIFLGRRIMRRHDGSNDSRSHSADSWDGDEFYNTETTSYAGQEHHQQLAALHSSGWLRRFDDAERDKDEFDTPSSYLQVMGMFTIWVGWYGFNTGSILPTSNGGGLSAARVAMNTTLAACAGGLGSYLHCYYMMPHINLSLICNGLISGLIAITASCDVCTSSQSLIIGLLAGLVIYPVFHHVTRLLKLDDPVDAIPVHASAGLFGVLAVPFCRPDCSFYKSTLRSHESIDRFCTEDYQIGRQLAAQVWGALTIIVYTCCMSLFIWGLPAVSECAIALEDKHIDRVASILIQISLAAPTKDEQTKKDLINALQQSRMAESIFRQYGWVNDQFEKPEHNEPAHLLHVCRCMKSEQDAKTKSALEIVHWQTCCCLAELVRQCQLHRCCTFRLRIVPASELSGVGSTDIEGGWIFALVQRLIKKETASSAASTSQSLQKEVRQLHALVHGQQAILRALTKASRQRSHRLPKLPTITDVCDEENVVPTPPPSQPPYSEPGGTVASSIDSHPDSNSLMTSSLSQV